jgi:competence protein ComEC
MSRLAFERERRLQASSSLLGAYWSFIQGQRLWIHDQLPASHLLHALILGGRYSEDSFLRTTGFVHLSTLTGIHLWLCLMWLQRLRIRWVLFVGSLLIFWLWCLSGLRFGLLRPWSILLLRAGLRKAGYPTHPLLPLGLIVVLECQMLLWFPDPWQAQGCLIYALAVGGGAMSRRLLPHHPHTSLALGSALLPGLYEAWHTGLVALGTPLWSLLSLPLLIHALFPILLLSLLTQNPWLLQAIAWVTTQLASFFDQLAKVPGNLWILEPLSLGWGFLLALCLQPKPKIAVLVLGALILSRLLEGPEKEPSRLIQLDVGQGDALLIQGYEGTGPPLQASTWLQHFARFRVQHLDFVGLTHLDQDHAGSLPLLKKLVSIGCISAPRALNVPGAEPFEGNCLPGWKAERAQAGPNGVMGILLLPFSDGFYLNAGDAPANMERSLHPPLSGTRRILKLSHHGSLTSTDPVFLDRVKPTEVWISVGKRNTFGHPHLSVLLRIKVPIHRTDFHGHIVLSLPDAPTESKR